MLDELQIQEIELYRNDPVAYFVNMLGRYPYDKQQEVLYSVVENPETFVRSANGVGKTDVAAGLVPWWLNTRRGIVLSTANTWKQVETVLWERIKLLIKEARVPTGLRAVGTKIKVDENWFALGLSTNEPDRFQGYHDAEVLVIVEEAGGMNVESLWDALEGCLTGPEDRLLAIGNPTSRGTVFYRRCTTPDPDRQVIHISAFDTPNVKTGETIVPNLISKERIERWRRQWGEDDPRWQSRVLGEFPSAGDTSMFPLAWLEEAFEYDGPDLSTGHLEAGLDVARYGIDLNALALRDGGKLLGMRSWGGIDLMKTTGKAVRCMRDGTLHTEDEVGKEPLGQPEIFRVDTDGLGSGVFDRMAEVRITDFTTQGVQLEEFKASHATTDPRNFADLKTEAYWNFREKLRTHSVDLSVLTNEQRENILNQATMCSYEMTSDGRIKVVEKRKAKQRGEETKKLDEIECLIITYFDSEVDGIDNSELAGNVGPYATDEERGVPSSGYGAIGRVGDEDVENVGDGYLYANIGVF